MMGKKILLVNDGVIALVSEDFRHRDNAGNAELELAFAECGVVLTVDGYQFCLPSDVLTHLEQTDGAYIYFYLSLPYELIAEYQGCISLNRDEILKVKGALEYSQRL